LESDGDRVSLVIALWLIFHVGLLGYLSGLGIGREAGRRAGRVEMAALVEAKYGPLLEQLEAFADSVDAFGDELSSEARRRIDERIEAMRKASRFN
jgi:hypothetical protein